MESIDNLTLPELREKYFEYEKKILEFVDIKNVWFNKMNAERGEQDKKINDLQQEQGKIYDLIKTKNV
jgi:hypothetical protein